MYDMNITTKRIDKIVKNDTIYGQKGEKYMRNTNNYYYYFSQLLKNELSESELCNLMCHEFKMRPSLFFKYINQGKYNYVVTKKSIGKLEELYSLLLDYRERNRQSLAEAKQMVTLYINSNHTTLNSFCKENGTSIETMNYYLDLINLFEDDYSEVCNKALLEKEMLEAEKTIANIKTIIQKIKTGIELEDGTIRLFDLVDYYQFVTQPPRVMRTLMRGQIPDKDRAYLNKFCSKYIDDKELKQNDIDTKYKEVIIINCDKDAKGRLIYESGRLITDEEKTAIIDYILSSGIPLTHGTYAACMKRVRENTFELKEKELSNNKKLLYSGR